MKHTIFWITGMISLLVFPVSVHAQNPSQANTTKPAREAPSYDATVPEHCMVLGLECEVVYPGASNVNFSSPTDYLVANLQLPENRSGK